jgi:antitoxin component YwqK of YwqJK toxin-antitoxin module
MKDFRTGLVSGPMSSFAAVELFRTFLRKIDTREWKASYVRDSFLKFIVVVEGDKKKDYDLIITYNGESEILSVTSYKNNSHETREKMMDIYDSLDLDNLP